MYRSIKTTQERRVAGRRSVINEDGYTIRLRASRSFKTLPNGYDEVSSHLSSHVSWKALRRFQWCHRRIPLIGAKRPKRESPYLMAYRIDEFHFYRKMGRYVYRAEVDCGGVFL